MKLAILGGGLAAISLAYFLQENQQIEEITIFEKEDAIGGLCRSIHKDGYTYDIGPHILFSKDKEMLNLMLEVAPETNKELLINNYLQNIPSCAILSSNISNCIGGKNGYTC